MDTEVFDVNGDFTSDVFTAPVTGKYLLQGHVNGYAARGSLYNYIRFITSNRDYYSIETPSDQVTGNNYYGAGLSVVADMDASDTFQVAFATNDDTTYTIRGDATNTWLSICLLA